MQVMRGLALAVIGVLAACGTDARVALELAVPQGDALAGATQIDVLLAGPSTFPRQQRANRALAPQPATWPPAVRERVEYLAARAPVISIPLEAGQAVDHLRIQLEIDDGSHYVPVVAVRDANGAVLAIGVYDATELFKLVDEGAIAPYVATESGKLTIYPVQLESAKAVAYQAGDQPTLLPAGSVTLVPCGDQPSGVVWQRAATEQLRVLLPLDGSDDADPRLANIDMDCDQEIAGYGDGERNDCDDTLGTTNGKALELCNGVDDNCDDQPGFAVVDACQNQCGGAGPGVCSDLASTATADRCVGGDCAVCQIDGIDTEAGGVPTKRACEAQGHFLPLACAAGQCTVTLVYVDPAWEVKIGTGTTPDKGLGEPVMLDNAAAENLVIAAKSGDDYPAADVTSGSFVLLVKAGTVAQALQMQLGIVTGGAQTCSAEPALTCNN